MKKLTSKHSRKLLLGVGAVMHGSFLFANGMDKFNLSEHANECYHLYCSYQNRIFKSPLIGLPIAD
jgi:hypothetical protein